MVRSHHAETRAKPGWSLVGRPVIVTFRGPGGWDLIAKCRRVFKREFDVAEQEPPVAGQHLRHCQQAGKPGQFGFFEEGDSFLGQEARRAQQFKLVRLGGGEHLGELVDKLTADAPAA